MNAIVIDRPAGTRAAAAASNWAASLGTLHPRARASAEWLPVPAVRRAAPAAEASLVGVWHNAGASTAAEKTFLSALALAGVCGIAYGFSWLVDLVQNWAAFQTGISSLLQ